MITLVQVFRNSVQVSVLNPPKYSAKPNSVQHSPPIQNIYGTVTQKNWNDH